jgi:hypothetical protein
LKRWKEAQLVALWGYRPVLEDVPELSGSNEGSGDDQLTGIDAYACKALEAARISEDAMRILRETGTAGGLGTVSRTGLMAPMLAMFE